MESALLLFLKRWLYYTFMLICKSSDYWKMQGGHCFLRPHYFLPEDLHLPHFQTFKLCLVLSSQFSVFGLSAFRTFPTKKLPIKTGSFKKMNKSVYADISSILNLITPVGACTSATSPFARPINPLPIGEPMEILPALRSASFSPTIR